MNRVVKRVPMDFHYPLNMVWYPYNFKTEFCLSQENSKKCCECKAFAEAKNIPMLEHGCPDLEGYFKDILVAFKALVEPPKGEGYQLWETTSEGSPCSPVFETVDQLCEWCAEHATLYAKLKGTKEDWIKELTPLLEEEPVHEAALWKEDKEYGVAFYCPNCRSFVCSSSMCECGTYVDLSLPKIPYEQKYMKLYDYLQENVADYDTFDVDYEAVVTCCAMDAGNSTDDYDKFCVETYKHVSVIREEDKQHFMIVNWSELISANVEKFREFEEKYWVNHYDDWEDFIYQWINEIHNWLAGRLTKNMYKIALEFMCSLIPV